MIVAVGNGVDAGRIGERVIADCWLRDPDDPSDMTKAGYFGSEQDGGFAEYATVPAPNALAVTSDLTDAELAKFSCSYSTAEGMLNLVRYIEAEEIQPALAATYKLEDLHAAQTAFIAKKHTGNIVVTP